MTARKARTARPKPVIVPLDLQVIGAGGPAPVAEFMFARDIKRRWRVDYAWLEEKLVVEVEGAVWTQGRHTRGSGYLKDIEKYNELALRGWRLIRVTYEMLDIHDGRALAITLRALGLS